MKCLPQSHKHLLIETKTVNADLLVGKLELEIVHHKVHYDVKGLVEVS